MFVTLLYCKSRVYADSLSFILRCEAAGRVVEIAVVLGELRRLKDSACLWLKCLLDCLTVSENPSVRTFLMSELLPVVFGHLCNHPKQTSQRGHPLHTATGQLCGGVKVSGIWTSSSNSPFNFPPVLFIYFFLTNGCDQHECLWAVCRYPHLYNLLLLYPLCYSRFVSTFKCPWMKYKDFSLFRSENLV